MLPAQPSVPTRPRSIRPLLFAMFVICLLILASYIGRLRSLSAMDEQIAAAEVSVEQALARQQTLLDEHARQQDSAVEPIDQPARRDLDLIKPGDLAFTVIMPPTVLPSTIESETPNGAEPQRFIPTKPIWQQWMNLLLPE